MLESVRALSFVRTDPAPDCILREFGEDACTYSVRYWMDDIQRDLQLVRDDVSRLAQQVASLLSVTGGQALREVKAQMSRAKQSLDVGLVHRAYGQRMAGVHLAAFALNLQNRPRKPRRRAK